MKTCTKCDEEKDLDEFYKNKLSKGGYNTKCKVCSLAYRREYVKTSRGKANVEKHHAAARAATGTEPERLERIALLAEGLKKCTTCREVKSVYNYYHDGNDLYVNCRECHKAYISQRMAKPENRAKRRVYENTPERKLKSAARHAVRGAVKTGRLKKLPCEHCLNKGDREVQGHHESYETDRWLDVIWLCIPCHVAIHNQEAT